MFLTILIADENIEDKIEKENGEKLQRIFTSPTGINNSTEEEPVNFSQILNIIDLLKKDQEKFQEKVLSNQKNILSLLQKINKERQEDKKLIAQALFIFKNISSSYQADKNQNFQKSVQKGIEEIKNALLRIYDFVEK